MEQVTREDAEKYVEEYNSHVKSMPMSYLVYRELLGVFYFLSMNRRMREIIKRLVEIADENEVSNYNELIALFDQKTLESCFDADEIDEFFKIKVVDEE